MYIIYYSRISPIISQRVNNTAQLKELITAARFARCRSRFVMPVLLYNDKVTVKRVVDCIMCMYYTQQIA